MLDETGEMMMSDLPPTDRPLTAGDWIEHDGGPMPAISGRAEVKLRSGDCFTGSDLTDENTWLHIWGEGDIIAYRLSRPATSAASEVTGSLSNLKSQLERIAAKHPNEQPAYPNGCRPFSNGDLRHFIETLSAALASPPVSERPALTVWYGKMPESNGRENWTAELRRVNPTDKWPQGFCFARSEYPGRVLYEADRMRWIIGERAERPDILAYDADTHSAYVPPVSEREGELEGALRKIADGTYRRGDHRKIAARALTAQPAGEGK